MLDHTLEHFGSFSKLCGAGDEKDGTCTRCLSAKKTGLLGKIVTIPISKEANMKLKDKVAIVTGGARGIGEAIVRAYAAEGAHVVIADIETAKAQGLASELGAKGLAVQLDVRDSKSISALIATTVSKFGGVDILVNNAAIFDMAPILEVSEASFDNQFAVNVKGLFFTLQAVASQMAAQGRGGKIINMASQAGRRGEALVAVYCATKAAVISLTQSAGLGLIKHGINVNGIAPGVVDTPMWDQVDSLFAKYEKLPVGEKKRQVGAAVPAGRMGTPDDYRGVAIFLASHDSDYVVAQTFNVDGGNWMS
jgi:NAD(P)-dependent dehydrogenase (short-subunit alcohol dehydrogenase family)